MKSSLLIPFILFSFIWLHNPINAQSKQKAKIQSIILKGNIVELSISSRQAFYIGGNSHILYIDKQKFELNRQENKGDKGLIVFLIPQDSYNKIADKSDVYMSYGDYLADTATAKECATMLHENPMNAWYLGTINKKKIKN